jgi:hypothetical protein
MTVAGRDAAIAHDDSDLVQSFGQKRPVIPIVGGAAQVCARVAFDGLIQIRELARIADEEHRLCSG